MEITYQNNRDDFEAFYQHLWEDRRKAQRNEFYHSVLWYLAVLGLAAYLAIKHDETFAVCIYVVLASFYLKQNWSFDRHWRAQIEASSRAMPEHTCKMVLGENGITEHFLGVVLSVPWSEVRRYEIVQDRLLVWHVESRAFLIPLKNFSAGERTQLIETLESHKVKRQSEK